MSMLKNTKEYGKFGNFVEDSGGNAMRIPTHLNVGKENANQGGNGQTELDDQAWVPNDAFQMAYQFRTQHGNDLSPELIN